MLQRRTLLVLYYVNILKGIFLNLIHYSSSSYAFKLKIYQNMDQFKKKFNSALWMESYQVKCQCAGRKSAR